ncbi:MAG: type IV pilus twitching motility protein PilT [Candidatus Sericytochromatia bacterium]|nr:type IV pilus twitching motility protein PilT [Candidatus Sericytochromatia bacterium]
MNILDFLRNAVQKRASDIHIKVGVPPILRIDGRIVPTEYKALTPADTRQALYSLMSADQRQQFENSRELDISLTIEGLSRFRVNVYFEQGNIGAAMRVIPIKTPTVDTLNLPPVIKKLALERQGLILCTGPTGSGKSTTLTAMLEFVNTTKDVHIITVEDPVEFVYTSKKSVVTQREVGQDTMSFPAAIKYALRQDPDVILIGEMRDQETIMAAVKAAETGHLVLSTLHTTDAVQTLIRIISSFDPHEQEGIRQQLSQILRGSISQRLIPRANGQGRVAAIEVLVSTPTVSDLIGKNEIDGLYGVLDKGSMEGMQSMNMALFNLYQDDLISLDDALSYSEKPNELQRMMRGAYHGSGGTFQAGLTS